MKTQITNSNKVFLLAKMLFKDLLRRRVTLLILFIIPLVFNVVILLITSDKEDPVVFGILADDNVRLISRQSLSFVFMGCAAVAFLTSFLAFNLVFKQSKVDHRLVMCGYKPIQIIVGKLLILLGFVLSITIYEGLILLPFLAPDNFLWLITGFFLAGLTYACYGLLIGVISKHELEGIFMIILLTNVDIGWLQNPMYYNESSNKAIIEHMPGFFPTQLANLGAFTHEFNPVTIWGSLIYSLGFLSAAFLFFWFKVKIKKSNFISDSDNIY